MANVTDSELFVNLINHGNFIEIAAELERLSIGTNSNNI